MREKDSLRVEKRAERGCEATRLREKKPQVVELIVSHDILG